ncbi:MAG: hypothetical protein CMJ58_22070 [Planctomycetaceae bacterium]|nr:hypothetical protein [Planctomycetaceae bacterium]
MVEEVQRRTGRSLQECRRILSCPTLDEYWRLTGDGPNDLDERDPAESDSSLAPYLLRATLETERKVGPDGDIGYCFAYWDRKKRILREQYGVHWRTPAEMNPETFYD